MRVSRIDRESASVFSLLLVSADGEPLAAALPGQFVVLRLHVQSGAPPVLRSYSLSNLPVSYGALLFATLGGTSRFPLVMWTLATMCLIGAALYALMKTGSRHRAAPPVPEVD